MAKLAHILIQNMSLIFYTLEIVDRDSETQLQLGTNLGS